MKVDALVAAQSGDRVHELHRRPHGSFGVILVGGRGSPNGHHGIAYELLDDAAVALDHRAR